MLHYMKQFGDDVAECGALLVDAEKTIFRNTVQCPECRDRMKATGLLPVKEAPKCR
jgi:hypothetical protein